MRYPVTVPEYREALTEDERCPECGHDLDTGWECINCGYDAQSEVAND